MAFVLYFFSIEVPVSYLNKVISKSGTVHIHLWKDWGAGISTVTGIRCRVVAICGAHQFPTCVSGAEGI